MKVVSKSIGRLEGELCPIRLCYGEVQMDFYVFIILIKIISENYYLIIGALRLVFSKFK